MAVLTVAIDEVEIAIAVGRQVDLMAFRILVFGMLILNSFSAAKAAASYGRRCPSAFSQEIRVRTRAFFVSGIIPGETSIRWYNIPIFVRKTILHLAKSNDLKQMEKVDFWNGIAHLINERSATPFSSDEFDGTDGSILFQGTGSGAWLVIRPNGDVYKGKTISELPREANPQPIWQADYSRLTKVEPE